MKNAAASTRTRALVGLGVRVAITLGALGWTLSFVSIADLARSIALIGVAPFVGAAALMAANLLLGAVRWRVILQAYGAVDLPPLPELIRIYFVSFFFNTFLPANIAGDVLRAHVTRSAFGGPVGAYLIVVIERIFGLAGLVLLAASLMTLRPIGEALALRWLAAVGVLAACATVLAPPIAVRFADKFPARIRIFLGKLPRLRSAWMLVPALVLSVGTQALLALAGHVLIHSLNPQVDWTSSLSLIPVALVAVYLPTVAGLGTREAAFVLLFSQIGVAAASATAASLSLFASQLIVACLGGLLHFIRTTHPKPHPG